MPRITRTQNDCLWRQVSMFVAFSFGRCEKGEAGKWMWKAKKKPKMLTKWHKLFNFLGWWVGRRRKLDIFAFFFHLKNMIFTFRRAPGRAGGRYKKSFCLKRRTDLKTKHERKTVCTQLLSLGGKEWELCHVGCPVGRKVSPARSQTAQPLILSSFWFSFESFFAKDSRGKQTSGGNFFPS